LLLSEPSKRNNTRIERLIVAVSPNEASISDATQGYKVELVFMDSDDAKAFIRRTINTRYNGSNYPVTYVVSKQIDNLQQTLEVRMGEDSTESDNEMQQQFV